MCWSLRGYFWREFERWNLKISLILDFITQSSSEWTYWVCAVTLGCRSWCDCQNCEMRERERWDTESVSEYIKRREGETVRLTGECVLEEEWMTDICISFGMWNHWIINLPSNRRRYVSSFFIFSFGWICYLFIYYLLMNVEVSEWLCERIILFAHFWICEFVCSCVTLCFLLCVFMSERILDLVSFISRRYENIFFITIWQGYERDQTYWKDWERFHYWH